MVLHAAVTKAPFEAPFEGREVIADTYRLPPLLSALDPVSRWILRSR